MMSDETTLLPCPFCGGEASVIDHHNDDGSVSVGCDNDTCLGFSGLGWLYKTEAEAIAAWNTRATLTCEVVGSYYYDDYDQYEFEFSCGHSVNMYDKEPPNYCPNCGAKVIEEVDNADE